MHSCARCPLFDPCSDVGTFLGPDTRFDFDFVTGQFQEVHSPDKLSDHDIVAGTLKIFIPPRKKPRRKVYLYQKGDFDSMRRDSSNFAKD